VKARATIDGTLLDAVLRMLGGATKTTARKLVKNRRIAVDGVVQVRPDLPVRSGQRLEIVPREEAPKEAAARPAGHPPFAVLFEDEHLLAVDKPAGLLSIATEKEQQRTLYRMVSAHVKEATGGLGRFFIVHRHDRDVSGVMVFAKDAPTKRRLQAGWATAEKVYLALVEGRPPATEGTVKSWLCENSAFRVYVCDKAAPGAHEAVTHYRVVGEGGAHSLLELRIETGRKHQIRVHLASLGCPVVGDRVYGRGGSGGGMALHAHALAFVHPFTGLRLTIRSPLPARLRVLRSPRARPAAAPR
jgi:23S rRNA pseudouridine1911/1915/1917 synthase